MTRTLNQSSSRIITALSACLIAFPFLVSAADDDYLKAIEAETESLQVDRGGVINKDAAAAPSPTAAPSSPAPTATVDAESTGAGPSQTDFEGRLQSESRSLFRYYKKLTDTQKNEVFEEFKSKNDIKALRPTIVRLYTGR